MKKQYKLVIEAYKILIESNPISINELAKRMGINWRTAKEVYACVLQLELINVKHLKKEISQ